MFSSQQKPKPSRSPASSNGATVDSWVGPGTDIEGTINVAGSLHVDGTVKGTIVADEGNSGVVTVSESGTVEGDITAPHVIINGRVCGDLRVNEHLELAARACVEGNVYYQVLQMAAGAQVDGRLVREESAPAHLPSPDKDKKDDDKTDSKSGSNAKKEDDSSDD